MEAKIVGKVQIKAATHIYCKRCMCRLVPIGVKHCGKCKEDIKKEIGYAWEQFRPKFLNIGGGNDKITHTESNRDFV